MREKKSKSFLILAIVFAVSVCAVFCAALLYNNRDSNSNTTDISAEISEILSTKEVILAKDSSKLAEFSAKIQEISDNLDKIEQSGALKNENAKSKFDEAKNSFAKLEETGKLAKVIAGISNGVSDETIMELKENEKLKAVGEALEKYESKLKEFKANYSGDGEEMQAVLDYSELEKIGDELNNTIENLELSEATSDEITLFYVKIEKLRDIISK